MIKQFTRFITEAPDPAKAMQHFDQFLDKLEEIGEDKLLKRTLSLLASSEGMRRLAHLLGSSDYLWDNFLQIHFTELIPMIEADSKPPDKAAMQRELRAALDRSPKTSRETSSMLTKTGNCSSSMSSICSSRMRRCWNFHDRSRTLAKSCVDEAARMAYERLADRFRKIDAAQSPGRVCDFRPGKFGGREMGYASDLELLFVHDGDSEFFSKRWRIRLSISLKPATKAFFTSISGCALTAMRGLVHFV